MGQPLNIKNGGLTDSGWAVTQREVVTSPGLETGGGVLPLPRLKENPRRSVTEDLDKLEKQIRVAKLNRPEPNANPHTLRNRTHRWRCHPGLVTSDL